VTIAAGAANIVERNPDRRVGISSLHRQIKINNRAACITRDKKPMMFGDERRTYRRPEPCILLGG